MREEAVEHAQEQDEDRDADRGLHGIARSAFSQNNIDDFVRHGCKRARTSMARLTR